MSATLTETKIPMAESLMEGIGQVVTPGKAAYSRLRTEAGTLAYSSPRKDGVLLDFAASVVEKAPAKFQKMLEAKNGGRTVMHVTTKNEKTAVALLEWVAGQVG